MASDKKCVGVIGATGAVGRYVLPLFVEAGWNVIAFSRKKRDDKRLPGIRWRVLCPPEAQFGEQIQHWVSLAPITALSDYFPLLVSFGARRIVAISSTSRFTKISSPDARERRTAKNLAESEEALIAWAKKENVVYTILRPTMIYDFGRDKNITLIARFIKRFGFFCILGEAEGLRQPVHARDVASACAAALQSQAAENHSYNLSGGEVLSYREMVNCIFFTLGKKPRLVKIPLGLFHAAVFVLRVHPRFRHWSSAMAQRMNQDMIFDHEEARRDLHFAPLCFDLTTSGWKIPME
jgi:nucleoside-diphosphate-sugar epimerase